jgi:hypothetical protein
MRIFEGLWLVSDLLYGSWLQYFLRKARGLSKYAESSCCILLRKHFVVLVMIIVFLQVLEHMLCRNRP